MELIAHGKSSDEIAQLIGADAMIYQDLDDLREACAQASPNGAVKDFEGGVFNGEYQTPVPEGYLQHLSENRGKKRKLASNEEAANGTLVGNSGPTNIAGESSQKMFTHRNPENREDIRCVFMYYHKRYKIKNKLGRYANIAI